jgi:signal peptidase II
MSLRRSFAARRGYFALAAGVFILDQLSKLASDYWLRGRPPVAILPGWFNLVYSRNRGGLFGYFGAWPEPWRTVTLTAIPLVAVVAIALFLARTDEPDRSTLAGLAMILGGAAGNLLDRVVRSEVVDFLDVYVSSPGLAEWFLDKFGTAHWPTFNLADSAIVVGSCLLILDIFRPEPKPRADADATQAS